MRCPDQEHNSDCPLQDDVAAVVYPEVLHPGTELPFAWDEPKREHVLVIKTVLRTSSTGMQPPEASTKLELDKMQPSKGIKPLTIKGSSAPKGGGGSGGGAHGEDAKARLEGAISQGVQRKVRRAC
jgi:hypothetical protein